MSEIEFATVVQEGFFDVGLDYVCAVGAVGVFLFCFYEGFYLLEGFAYFYAVATVGVLSRLNYPCALLRLSLGLRLLIPLIIVPQKLEIILIFQSLFNMKRMRKIIEHIIIFFLVV